MNDKRICRACGDELRPQDTGNACYSCLVQAKSDWEDEVGTPEERGE
jgi:hypothetical protein